jgi:hypothetical protein
MRKSADSNRQASTERGRRRIANMCARASVFVESHYQLVGMSTQRECGQGRDSQTRLFNFATTITIASYVSSLPP